VASLSMTARSVAGKNVIALRGRPPHELQRISQILDTPPPGSERFALSLPFSRHDATAGVENELQAVVVGSSEDVDLPRFIAESNYYRNVVRRGKTGDGPISASNLLDAYLEENPGGVWENSWVRVPVRCLCSHARAMLSMDMLSDKSCCDSPKRRDADRFCLRENGEEMLRIPVSYLLKLSLADVVGLPDTPDRVRRMGDELMSHFLSDNTSPETFSFFPSAMAEDGRIGSRVAAETQKRFLLCQLLTQYANTAFEWLLSFLYTGSSKTTGAVMSFHVIRHRT